MVKLTPPEKTSFEKPSFTCIDINKLRVNKWRVTSYRVVCRIAIYQRIACCKPTGCKFTTLRISTCEWKSVRVANLRVNNFRRCEVNLGTIKCSILKNMPSIFMILYSKILHIFIFLSNIYYAVGICQLRCNHTEVLYKNSCSEHFGKYSGKYPL